jgi:riboflavin kinase/FMN adenylyltransferase
MTTLYANSKDIPAAAKGCVLAIGNFDGIHQGHRALIKQAADIAKAARAPLGIVTFEPHPRQFFQPEAEPFRLTLLPMKQRLLQELGVDHIFALSFNRELSQLTGEEFIDRILMHDLKARHVVVGENFAFGRGRSGTVQTLAAAHDKFKLTVVKPVLSQQGQLYSSSAIRELLKQGQFAAAEKGLGWPWQIETLVVGGDKRGRELGYPTANQNVPDYVQIPYGIYAVRVRIEGETTWRDGVANFGVRPMFQIPQPIFETFIFDFSSEIYGKNMRVQPVQHLRPEQSFTDIAALVAQMKEDCIMAKAVLKSTQTLQTLKD